MHLKPKQDLVAVRKMAAKKSTQVQFQMDVSSEEEWNKLLEKKGLTVVDVYSEWCGPCIAMVSTLKKLKLEIVNDYLYFAVAKSDSIQALQRFRNKSEPTWMLIASGNLVNVMLGVNAPALIQLIKEELEKEINVLEKRAERKSLSFNELTEAEKKREEIIIHRKREKEIQYQQKLAKKMNIIRERSLMKLSNLIPNYSCIIYLPHMIAADGNCVVAQKMMYINDTISVAVIDQISIQLNKTIISQIFYKCPIFEKFTKSLKFSLENKRILVTLLQTMVNEDTCEILSPRITMENNYQTIEQKLCKIVYGCENPTDYSEQSVAYEFIVENENGEKIPPMWTPINNLSKAAAIEILFPRKVESIGYVPEQLPPPQILIIYEANKAFDIVELIKEHKDDVYRVGFFSSVHPQSAKFVCKTYEQYRNLPEEQIRNVKMVVALKKKETEDLLLEFSHVIPLYISPNEEYGTEESEQFFPFDYEDIEEVNERELDADEDKKNIDIDNY